jgi:hypothetical protein
VLDGQASTASRALWAPLSEGDKKDDKNSSHGVVHGTEGFCGVPGQGCPLKAATTSRVLSAEPASATAFPTPVMNDAQKATVAAHGTGSFCGLPGEACPEAVAQPRFGLAGSQSAMTTSGEIQYEVREAAPTEEKHYPTWGFCGPPGMFCGNGPATLTVQMKAQNASIHTSSMQYSASQTYEQLTTTPSSTTVACAANQAPTTLLLTSAASCRPDNRAGSPSRSCAGCLTRTVAIIAALITYAMVT